VLSTVANTTGRTDGNDRIDALTMRTLLPPTGRLSRRRFRGNVMFRCARRSRLGLAARPGLLPDISCTLAGQPVSGPYRQVGQPCHRRSAMTGDRLIYRSCRESRGCSRTNCRRVTRICLGLSWQVRYIGGYLRDELPDRARGWQDVDTGVTGVCGDRLLERRAAAAAIGEQPFPEVGALPWPADGPPGTTER
jgi:hypothetical protein